MRTDGRAVIRALNAEGVDLFVPGNWEYGFGPEALRARVADMSFPVHACNVHDAATGELLFRCTGWHCWRRRWTT